MESVKTVKTKKRIRRRITKTEENMTSDIIKIGITIISKEIKKDKMKYGNQKKNKVYENENRNKCLKKKMRGEKLYRLREKMTGR